MKTCNKCEKQLPLESFHKDSHKADGLRTICKDCTRIRHEDNRSLIKEYQNLWGGCAICGYNKCDDAIDFHHIKGPKLYAIAIMRSYSPENLKRELVKTIPLCKCCHAEHHRLETPSKETLQEKWEEKVGDWGLDYRE